MMTVNLKKFILPSILLLSATASYATTAPTPAAVAATPAPTLPTPTAQPIPTAAQPTLSPAAPSIAAKGFILIDANSNKVLAESNPDQRMQPASLTKMMTSYVISAAVRARRINLDDQVRISEKAWRTGGSKMFVKIGTTISARDLMQGIIVDSGNDACIAMAEHVAGSEEGFVSMMNQEAQRLGMKNTHFIDSTGLPNPEHYSTPRDMAILARALIVDFPEDYKWYSQKWFTYNGIKQPNRNRLLWRDPSVDGVKTGHTDEAGFCLVASAEQHGMRIVSVVMGAPSDSARADDSQKLITYGFRFFDSRKLLASNSEVSKTRVWYGQNKEIPLGVAQDVFITTPIGQQQNLKSSVTLNEVLKAPITKGQTVGTLTVTLNNDTITTLPLIAMQDDPKGGLWTWLVDSIRLLFHRKA